MPSGTRQPQPTNTARIAVNGTFDTTRWTNVFWCQFETSAPALEGDVHAFTDDFLSAIERLYLHCHTLLSVIDAHCTFRNSDGVFIESTNGAEFNGTLTGDPADAQAAAVVSWIGRWHYRGGKPRTYVPGLANEVVVGTNKLDSGYIDTLTVDANHAFSNVNAIVEGVITDTDLGTVTFSSAGAWREVPFFRTYTSAVVHPRLGTQRGRLGPYIP